jgi:hypothetical protein
MPPRYELVYAEDIPEHLRAIEAKHSSLIRRTIEEQLSYQPLVETRNRKPLMRPGGLGAEWELRFGPGNQFRVFYRVEVIFRRVHVLAVGAKSGNRLLVGGEEWRL